MNAKSCALIAGATALAPAAHATVITTPVNQSLVVSSSTYDLTSNGGPDLTFSNAETGIVGVIANGSSYWVEVAARPAVDPVTVGSADTFETGAGALANCSLKGGCSGPFATNGSTQYLGFEFDPSGHIDYGYVTLSITGGVETAPVLDLVSFTYDDSGNSINTPQVPEPSTLALLATGLAGIAALRARRKARQ